MVKPGGKNHPHSRSIFAWSTALNKTPDYNSCKEDHTLKVTLQRLHPLNSAPSLHDCPMVCHSSWTVAKIFPQKMHPYQEQPGSLTLSLTKPCKIEIILVIIPPRVRGTISGSCVTHRDCIQVWTCRAITTMLFQEVISWSCFQFLSLLLLQIAAKKDQNLEQETRELDSEGKKRQ